MTGKNKKQFGIWMDSHNATIVGREQTEKGAFVIIAHEKNISTAVHNTEHAANNAERTLQHKFFRGITAHMQNAEALHVSGTGQVQEQFINYMAETAQFKNTTINESTSNKMSDDRLIEFIGKKFNP